jgi:hypothetical protein
MAETNELNRPGKAALWTGRVLSTLAVLMLLMGVVMNFLKPPSVMEGFDHLGWPRHLALALGIIQLACTVLYAIPVTSVLGAILLTGYLGGAVATHLRIGEPQLINAVVFGIVVWLGLFLREPRLRSLIPLTR